MNLQEFQSALGRNPDHGLLLKFGKSQTLARHFHVTEVGKVTKDFMDCGGTLRSNQSCVLQTLVAGDVEHRITAGKLANILEKSTPLKLTAELPVEAEIQGETIGIYAFASVKEEEGHLIFELSSKQTACLAPDACGIEPELVQLPIADESGCCGSSGDC